MYVYVYVYVYVWRQARLVFSLFQIIPNSDSEEVNTDSENIDKVFTLRRNGGQCIAFNFPVLLGGK